MENALNSDTPGGFKHENAIASKNGLALLASHTLKNALNINNSNTSKNNNNHKEKYNHLNLNHSNIKHHKIPQPQYGFMSSSTTASAASSSSASNSATKQSPHLQQQIQEHQNTFTFTKAGLHAKASNGTIDVKTESGGAADKQPQQHKNKLQTSQSATTVATLSPANNNSFISATSTNHHEQQTNNTSSAKDPSLALLEALSIKPNKKQKNVVSQQQRLLSTTQSAVGNSTGNGNNSNSNRNNFKIPSDILDDLASRFIINVPDMELTNLIRICFQVELAHWFYLDFFCTSEEEKKLQPCGIKQFALQIFEHIPFLRHHLSSIDKILEEWKNYKLSVPTCGGILISEDLNYCLLVQSYFSKNSWGFPKGKINENEEPEHCATREVYEETGYNISELIVPNEYIETVINYQYTRLYIVRDVSLQTKFAPRTRNEIKCCDWFPIDSLPVNKNDAISKAKLGINANSFFMIMPFVKRLKKWVNDKRNGVETRRKYSNSGTPTTSNSPLTTTVMHFMNGQQHQQKNSNSKKQPKHLQQRSISNNINDDINALNNGAFAQASTSSSCGNNINTNVNCSNNNKVNSDSSRSKRQRHKSMGDLDGIKLNNNINNESNCKSTNNCGSNVISSLTNSTSTSTTITNSGGNNLNNCSYTNSNQKRNSSIVAAGSNVNNGCNNNNNNNNNNKNGNNSTTKRQLLHSQSQTNTLPNGEKIVSSFDLIRKEKQQMKTAQAKAQKQQQSSNSSININNVGGERQRAKSQSDKMGIQQNQYQQQQHQQQQQQQQQKSNGNNKQRIQKQQTMIVTNSNMRNHHFINSNHTSNNYNSNKNNNNGNNKIIVNNSFNNAGEYKTPTPPPQCVNDLLAITAATAAATTPHNNNNIKNVETISSQGGNSPKQQKPRPSSVSLHFPEISIKRESTDLSAKNMPQLQRMASGTNLRILKRSTSHQPQQQRQAAALQFTPSFNSWTNFTFTKNFIANIFC